MQSYRQLPRTLYQIQTKYRDEIRPRFGLTVRRWVLERGGERVEEGKWKLEELDAAEEIFLTNARIGIRPVRTWKGRILATSTIGLALNHRFFSAD